MCLQPRPPQPPQEGGRVSRVGAVGRACVSTDLPLLLLACCVPAQDCNHLYGLAAMPPVVSHKQRAKCAVLCLRSLTGSGAAIDCLHSRMVRGSYFVCL
jgi:hypothetical protein